MDMGKIISAEWREEVQQWEYLRVRLGAGNHPGIDELTPVRVNDEVLEEGIPTTMFFNRLGAQGWELVSAQGEVRGSVYTFKRPRVSGGQGERVSM